MIHKESSDHKEPPAPKEPSAYRKPDMDDSWYKLLEPEFKKNYMRRLRAFLKKELSQKTLYPPMPMVFNAFKKTPFDKIKVVILGQDPYHGPGQAHGLCFSVQPPVPPHLP